MLADTQRLEPSPVRLGDYSQAHLIGRMGERGDNFAALAKILSEEPKAKETYLAGLRQLRPREVDDVRILSGRRRASVYAEGSEGENFRRRC